MNAALPSGLVGEVASAQRRLQQIYCLEIELDPARFVLAPEDAQHWLPPGSPRSGVLVVEEDGECWMGLYVDPLDYEDPHTIVEETSHLLCLAWHACHGRRVSRLLLELQSEVDRYAVARLSGADGFTHFRDFRWASWMGRLDRERYALAHSLAYRYCRSLERRFPLLADTPGLLRELRHFYRWTGERKLCAGRA